MAKMRVNVGEQENVHISKMLSGVKVQIKHGRN